METQIVRLAAIGRGSKSVVFCGFDLSHNRFVAIKESDDVKDEAKVLRMLACPQILECYGVRGRCMVCEYATFGSLAAWLGRVPHKHLGMVARGVAEALSATHRAGLVHSDVKPSNVLLCRCGPKLCDFGLNGTTFQYAAPEKLTKPDDEIPASDVWSLGMTILVAQIGKYPSTHSTCDDFWNALEVYESKNRIEKMCGEDLGSLRDDLYDFLDKCLAHDPRRRPTPTSLSAHAFCSSSCDDWKRPFASHSRGEDLLDSFLAKYDESSIEAERIHSLAQGLDMSISAVRSAIEKNGKIVVIERNRRRPYCCFRS